MPRNTAQEGPQKGGVCPRPYLGLSALLIGVVACGREPALSSDAADRFAEVVDVRAVIPSSGDGYDLFQASHLRTLSDGRIVVLNAGASEVLVFSSSGGLEARFGGAGGGPGEFSQPPIFLTTLPGDSILVTDRNLPSRGTVFTDAGSVARTFTLEIPSVGEWYVYPEGITEDRSLVTVQSHAVVGPGVTLPGMQRYPYRVFVYDLEGSLLHQFERGEIVREIYLLEREGFLRGASAPFLENGRFAAGPSGVALASTNSHHVLALDSDTRIRDTVRVPGAASTLPSSFVDSVRNAWAEAATTDATRVFRRTALRDILPPQVAPVIEDLHIDRLGRLWVAESNLDGGDATKWDVYSEDALLGFVDLPADLDVEEIGADYVLGIETSEFGEESVVRVTYRIFR